MEGFLQSQGPSGSEPEPELDRFQPRSVVSSTSSDHPTQESVVSERSEKELSQFEKLSAYCDTKDIQRKARNPGDIEEFGKPSRETNITLHNYLSREEAMEK